MGKTIYEAAIERALDKKRFSYTAHIPERRRDMKQEEWRVFSDLFDTTTTVFDRVKYLCRVGLLDESKGGTAKSLDLIKEVLKAGEVDIERTRDKAIELKAEG